VLCADSVVGNPPSLFLKGDRCYEKCTLDRRSYAPGQHGQGQARKKVSEYGIQLREKQKDPSDLWDLGKTVQELFCPCGPDARDHGGKSVSPPGTQTGQCDL